MRKLAIIISLLPVLMSSCRDDIDFKYDNSSPLLVIEGSITNLSSEVIVSRTIDMEDTVKRIPLADAKLSISSSDGLTVPLLHRGNGRYTPDATSTATPGITYTLRAEYDGEVYTSSSTMQKPAPLDTVWFEWYEGAHGSDQLTLRMRFPDIKDEANHYCYRIYRNGKIYKWGVTKDMGYENTTIDKTVSCVSRKTMENNEEEDREKILYDGDTITVSLLAIDLRTYDYLFSLNLSSSNGSNPYYNFTSTSATSPLGFFTAANISKKETVLRLSELGRRE